MPPIVSIVGGEATRLYPLTLNKSKFMLEIAGKPFIGHQLDLFKQNNIKEVILCIGRKGEEIQEYVKDGSAWGLEVKYAPEGPSPMGTGGTVKKAMPLVKDVFFVIYGDSYLDVPFGPVYEKFKSQNKPAMMTVFHNKNKYGKSNAVLKNGEIVKYDKKSSSPEMEHIDYGLSIMKKSIFDEWPENTKFDLAEVLMKLVGRGELAAYEVDRRFYEIGTMESLKETEQYIKGKQG